MQKLNKNHAHKKKKKSKRGYALYLTIIPAKNKNKIIIKKVKL